MGCQGTAPPFPEDRDLVLSFSELRHPELSDFWQLYRPVGVLLYWNGRDAVLPSLAGHASPLVHCPFLFPSEWGISHWAPILRILGVCTDSWVCQHSCLESCFGALELDPSQQFIFLGLVRTMITSVGMKIELIKWLWHLDSYVQIKPEMFKIL